MRADGFVGSTVELRVNHCAIVTSYIFGVLHAACNAIICRHLLNPVNLAGYKVACHNVGSNCQNYTAGLLARDFHCNLPATLLAT